MWYEYKTTFKAFLLLGTRNVVYSRDGIYDIRLLVDPNFRHILLPEDQIQHGFVYCYNRV